MLSRPALSLTTLTAPASRLTMMPPRPPLITVAIPAFSTTVLPSFTTAMMVPLFPPTVPIPTPPPLAISPPLSPGARTPTPPPPSLTILISIPALPLLTDNEPALGPFLLHRLRIASTTTTNPPGPAHLDCIRSRRIPLRHRQPQRARERVLLGLFDLAQLLLARALLPLLFRLAFDRSCIVAVAFGVPIEVAALLPAADGGFEAVAEVVFAVRGVCDFVPAEVDAAARAGFADAREEVHCFGDFQVDLMFSLGIGALIFS